jgi:hypothetical protein
MTVSMLLMIKEWPHGIVDTGPVAKQDHAAFDFGPVGKNQDMFFS